ncbi:MAG: serine/threonine-protein phosphatase [Rhodobacteraceae bacterium]|nr:serine/threonine-protein phosphatase [Paracoccaceae bacterium]
MTEYRYDARTHIGLKRKVNEDAVLAMPGQNIWVVSDGMGGHDAGDFASRLVTDAVATIADGLDPAQRMQALRDAIQGAHRAILHEAEIRGRGVIGATVAALMMADGHFVALWAGDSRIYRYREGGVEMLTWDHSAVAELVLSGQMSWDEADQHPQANAITRAVGVGDDLELDKVRGPLAPGDRFLICSDGLTRYATFGTLERVLGSCPIETASERLIQVALAGGGADNISVIVVDVL